MRRNIKKTIRDKFGNILCEHRRIRAQCKECRGSQICEHNRHRNCCKECRGSQICEHNRQRSSCKECRPMGVYKRYKGNARHRNIKFELTFEQYQTITKKPCEYCGDGNEINGIDQTIPGTGYTMSNSVPCCTQCNYMKTDYSKSEFLSKVNQIAKRQFILVVEKAERKKSIGLKGE